MDEAPIFRASKRRKFVRQREAEQDSDPEHPKPELHRKDNDRDEDDSQVNVSNLLRLRRQMRPRATGVQFSQHKTRDTDSEPADMMALSKVDPDQEQLKDMSSRFVGSTGQVVDIDKHMMAYIDSKMAENQSTISQAPQSISNTTPREPNPPGQSSKSNADYPSQSQLAEFDLGPDAHAKNLARTTAAIARAQSGLPPPPEDSKPHRPRRPRLGRDGKPLRPRPRKGRNSEDIARDALVEQMLHEHRMDVHEGETGVEADVHEEDENADERLAEQFKQEFLEAMAERQQKNQVKATTAAKAKGMGPEQLGPKLGGSRSARAKMAQMQQQQNQGQQQKNATGQK